MSDVLQRASAVCSIEGDQEAADAVLAAIAEIERLTEREKMCDRIIQRQALALMKIRTSQGGPIQIARAAMEPDDGHQQSLLGKSDG